ncbi:hypothetical protein F2Q70_00018765 [Brassica cretica]|uniref:Uncharacterized protein n=1 Tax=Brassica cretica TaxID=69181 RepID=A0A8S9I4Y3_BRACR|nr:hypothetical protein F2Q70_00018765 [Brassica cretica]
MPENVLQFIDRSLEKQDEVLLEDNEAESLTGSLAWSDKLEQEGLPELSIGKLSREFQEEVNTSSERQSLSCFGELMFPCFISELVKPDQEILAGFLVIKIMHSNLSLSLINVSEASPRRYLEKQHESLDDSFRLRSNSKEVIRSALTSLSSCTKSR